MQVAASSRTCSCGHVFSPETRRIGGKRFSGKSAGFFYQGFYPDCSKPSVFVCWKRERIARELDASHKVDTVGAVRGGGERAGEGWWSGRKREIIRYYKPSGKEFV